MRLLATYEIKDDIQVPVTVEYDIQEVMDNNKGTMARVPEGYSTIFFISDYSEGKVSFNIYTTNKVKELKIGDYILLDDCTSQAIIVGIVL